MSKQASPTLIGGFVFGALVLGTIAVFLLAGGQWFQEREQYIIYFKEGGQGLQVGSPVVFLGSKWAWSRKSSSRLTIKGRVFWCR